MAIFRYRMQNILELKEKLETQEKNNYAERHKQLDTEEEKLTECIKHRTAIEEEGKRLRLDTLDVRRIQENVRSREIAEDSVKKQRLKVRVAQKNLEAARQKMQEAMQERKIHEKLREKALEAFMAEEQANEIKQIDELTSYTFGKKTEEEG